MTNKQKNKFAMYLAVKAVLDNYNVLWQTLPAFVNGSTVLNSQVTLIQSLGQTQNLDTTGVAVDKKQAKVAMAQTAVSIGSAVRAYAVMNKNNTLATEVGFVQSEITGARDSDAIEHCQNIHDVANVNLAVLAIYGVTAARLATLQGVIDGFSLLVGKPRENIAAGRTVTQQLAAAFDTADEVLNEVLDNLIGQFEQDNPKFVSDYRNARTIVDNSPSHDDPISPSGTASPAPPKA